MKKERYVRGKVGVERGFGPRHAFNAQEGSEAVPGELPSPPDWVEEKRRRVAPGQGLSNLTPGILGGLREAGSQLAGMSKEDAAKLAISMLAGGEGEMPVPGEAGAVPEHIWDSWKQVQEPKIDLPQPPGKPEVTRSEIRADSAGNHYEVIGSHYDKNTDTLHAIVKPVPNPEGLKRGTRKVGVAKSFGPTHAENAKEGEDLTRVNTDTVPAMLTPREAVLNRNAAELAGRGVIEKLNSEGNQLAQKGVDLAAGGDKDVAGQTNLPLRPGGFSNELIQWMKENPDDPDAKRLRSVLYRGDPETAAQKGTSDMKRKVKQSKPQSGSPYVQAFQKLMPKGRAPAGYAQGSNLVPGSVPGTLPGATSATTGGANQGMPQFTPGPSPFGAFTPPPPPAGADPYSGMPQDQQNWWKATQAINNRGDINAATAGLPGDQAQWWRSKAANDWASGVGGMGSLGGGPLAWNDQYTPQPLNNPSQGGMGTLPPQGRRSRAGRMGTGSFYPQRQGFATGTDNVREIGDFGGGGPAYGPPVQLSAPQLQRMAQQSGLNAGQIQGMWKAFQAMQQGYGAMNGGGYANQSPSAGEDFGNPNYIGLGTPSYQGGISDIGYPPFLMPDAEYHADKGSSWVGPYDPKYLVQRYAGGTSYVSPFR